MKKNSGYFNNQVVNPDGVFYNGLRLNGKKFGSRN